MWSKWFCRHGITENNRWPAVFPVRPARDQLLTVTEGGRSDRHAADEIVSDSSLVPVK
jgi:hypothetical protein